MIKILLADDHSIIREALKTIIENNIFGSVTEEVANANEVIERIQNNDYDLLILDVNMPGLSSVDLVSRILSINANARILMFSMNPAVPFEKMYLKLGAKGYMAKTSSPDEIIKAIHTVINGHVYHVHTNKTDAMKTPLANPFNSLSPREFEIMLHILRGETVKEIFSQSGLAASTISTYKARIHEKLGTKNNIELISLARMHNIIKD